MRDPASRESVAAACGRRMGPDPDHPVREYVAAMATELAQMARTDGDEPLAAVLELAAAMAEGRPT